MSKFNCYSITNYKLQFLLTCFYYELLVAPFLKNGYEGESGCKEWTPSQRPAYSAD